MTEVVGGSVNKVSLDVYNLNDVKCCFAEISQFVV